jgi:hypothetical protein
VRPAGIARGGSVDPNRGRGNNARATPAETQGTTLERTLLRGVPGVGGYRKIVAGPGEPHLVRNDLVGSAKRKHHGERRGLGAFGQLTDMHILRRPIARPG